MKKNDGFSVLQENSYRESVLSGFIYVYRGLLGFPDLFHYRKGIKDDFQLCLIIRVFMKYLKLKSLSKDRKGRELSCQY